MATRVELPKLGLRPPAGLVAEWYLPDGASVHRGEMICRIEAENIAVELEAEDDGVLRHRLDAGFVRPAGDVLGVILGPGERMPDLPPVEEDEAWRPAVVHTGPSDVEWEEAVRAFRYWPPDGEAGEKPPPGATGDRARGSDEAPGDAEATAPRGPEPSQEPKRDFEIVPFPKRFANARPPSWDSVPGDAVDFASGLFERPGEEVDDMKARDAALDEALEALRSEIQLAEPAAGEAVFEAEPDGDAEAAMETLPGGADAAGFEAAGEREPEMVAEPHALMMRVRVQLAEARKLEEQLAQAWSEAGLSPAFEDVLVRAVGRALAEGGFGGGIVLRWFEDGCEQWAALHGAAELPFREAVEAIRSGTGSAQDAGCVITTYAGIDEASPGAPGDAFFALGVGDEARDMRWDGRRRMMVPVVTLTLAFDGSRVSEFAAARFLARVRELVEAPYALLAA
ncbi:MAG: hypothetical protein LC118_03470 [Dehalococcoidia bacterium]|nr:hypothetical protein [Dehalococcoidia bacterium]